jgi:hypothetical protein
MEALSVWSCTPPVPHKEASTYASQLPASRRIVEDKENSEQSAWEAAQGAWKADIKIERRAARRGLARVVRRLVTHSQPLPIQPLPLNSLQLLAHPPLSPLQSSLQTCLWEGRSCLS